MNAKATYTQLLQEACVTVKEAAEELFAFDKVAAPVPIKGPGYFARLYDAVTGGRRAKQTMGALSASRERTENLGKLLKRRNQEMRGLRAGSLREGVKDYMQTRGGKAMGALGATGLVAAPAAYAVGHGQGAEGKRRQRNVAFGAGMATGLAAPGMANAAGQHLQNTVARRQLPQQQPMQQPQYGGM